MSPTRSTAKRDAGTTSHALLGLLSVRPWTTYELAQQVQRSLNWFWPRAERKLYDDPKRLAASGLATATEEFTGRRKRTVYAITDEGRAELRAWLATPSADPAWENEALVKVFFADGGDLATLQGTLSGMYATARRRLAELARMAQEAPPFPDRRHLGALSIRLAQEQEEATLRWAEWALVQVGSWVATDDPGEWDADDVFDRLVEAGGVDLLS
jgi:PadR family transcriptional regulator, regulatory protein AphA